MRFRACLYLWFFCLPAILSGPAFAEGITSQSGPLPLGASGAVSMTIYPPTGTNASGNVAIGPSSSDPGVNLKISRGLSIGTDEDITSPPKGIVLPACPASKEGTISQDDPPTGALYFCNGTKWVLIGAQ